MAPAVLSLTWKLVGRCVGYYGEEDSPSRRLGRPLVFCRTESDCPLENGYARPVEGIHVLVDMRQMQVIEFEDRNFVPLPPPDPLRNYTAAASRGGVDRTDIKPLLITQPEGPSFRVNGHAVEWQKVGISFQLWQKTVEEMISGCYLGADILVCVSSGTFVWALHLEKGWSSIQLPMMMAAEAGVQWRTG
jgi:hypothetical protein